MTKKYETVEVMWSDWKVYKRTPCEVYTRVMWYIRPVSAYWIWKKSEMYSRRYYLESKIDNSEFLKKYLYAKPCSCNP